MISVETVPHTPLLHHSFAIGSLHRHKETQIGLESIESIDACYPVICTM